jgi:hypothetical protein
VAKLKSWTTYDGEISRKNVTVFSVYSHREVKDDKVLVVVMREAMTKIAYPDGKYYWEEWSGDGLGFGDAMYVKTYCNWFTGDRTIDPAGGGGINFACTVTANCGFLYDVTNPSNSKNCKPLEVKFEPGERAKAVFFDRIDPARIATVKVSVQDGNAPGGAQCGIEGEQEDGTQEDFTATREAAAIASQYEPPRPVVPSFMSVFGDDLALSLAPLALSSFQPTIYRAARSEYLTTGNWGNVPQFADR